MNKKNKIIKISFSIILILSGAFFSAMSSGGASLTSQSSVYDPLKAFVSNLGLAMVIAGIIALFEILVMEEFDREELADAVARKIPPMINLPAHSLKLVAERRHQYDGYYDWVKAHQVKELFIVGRSVLSSVKSQMHQKNLGDLATHIVHRLNQGTTIRILFMDPRITYIDNVLLEEKAERKDFFAKVGMSLDVCEEISNLTQTMNPSGHLYIATYKLHPYLSYHKQDDRTVVGFYFLSILGSDSPAYEVVDETTRRQFEKHFESVAGQSIPILSNDPNGGQIRLWQNEVAELRKFLDSPF